MLGDLRRRTSEVRYARSGTAHVAYRVAEGPAEGRRDLVLNNGGTMPMDALFEDPVALRLLEGLADLGRLVMFDRCGIGLSDPPPDADVSTITQWIEDVTAVMDAAEVLDPVLVGARLGADAAVVWCARHPGVLSALVLFEPSHGMRIDRGAVQRQIEGEVDSVGLWFPSRAEEPGFREWFNDAGRRGASPRLAADAYGRITDDDLLAIENSARQVQAPTLLLRRPAHPLSPSRKDDLILALLPAATRVDLPGIDLSPLGSDVDSLISEITGFITGEHRAPVPDRELVAILYTDLVASTDRATALGDAHWKRALDRHDAISLGCIRRRAGTLIKTTGDGILATFPSVTNAVRAAQDLHLGIQAEGLGLRAGIHVGDIDRRGDDISGINVVIAARILDHAGSGDTVLSATALTALGERIRALPRGHHTLKGIPGTWALYAISDT